MKFIHTSDWHLGRQFHNVSLLEAQRDILFQLVDYIRQHDIDALIIAGDIYDRSVPPTTAIVLLNDIIEQLCQNLHLTVIMIPGNHDSAKRLGFAASQMRPSGLYILSAIEDFLTPVILPSQHGDIAFYGLPYVDPEHARYVFDQPFKSHDDVYAYLCHEIVEHWSPEQQHVLLAHCFVNGSEESESERPLSIGGADRVSSDHFVPFDYVALGHLHQPQQVSHPYIRYAGSLMKYSFSEQFHRKGMNVVSFSSDGLQDVSQISFAPQRDLRVVEGYMADILQQGEGDPGREDYLLVRLLDQHAILDPMDTLRKVYPNVLHLEKPGMLIDSDMPLTKARVQRDEGDMFRDFFSQIQGTTLTTGQSDALDEILRTLRHTEE